MDSKYCEAKKIVEKYGQQHLLNFYDQRKEVEDILLQNGYINIYSKKDYGGNDRIVICKYGG